MQPSRHSPHAAHRCACAHVCSAAHKHRLACPQHMACAPCGPRRAPWAPGRPARPPTSSFLCWGPTLFKFPDQSLPCAPHLPLPAPRLNGIQVDPVAPQRGSWVSGAGDLKAAPGQGRTWCRPWACASGMTGGALGGPGKPNWTQSASPTAETPGAVAETRGAAGRLSGASGLVLTICAWLICSSSRLSPSGTVAPGHVSL